MSSPSTLDPAGLLAGWRDAVHAAGGSAGPVEVDAAAADLLRRWAGPDRHYHDTEHLTEVLAAIDLLAGHAGDVAAVRLAAWFHDAVLDGRPGHDEQASALLAEQVLGGLGLPAARVAAVARLVRLTADHTPSADDLDGAVLSDADLAVLAAPADRYARYAAGVRAEYAHLPDVAFRAGRAAVLERLAAAPELFRTRTGQRRWEAAARANMAQEVAELRTTLHG